MVHYVEVFEVVDTEDKNVTLDVSAALHFIHVSGIHVVLATAAGSVRRMEDRRNRTYGACYEQESNRKAHFPNNNRSGWAGEMFPNIVIIFDE